ncbi:hypothetical protein [Mesorhizobium sp.]|nr:hypothetical protein [Mesorhizobium sp.]
MEEDPAGDADATTDVTPSPAPDSPINKKHTSNDGSRKMAGLAEPWEQS